MRQLAHSLDGDNVVAFQLVWKQIMSKSEKVYKYFAQDCKVMIVYPCMWDFAGKMYSEQHFYRFSLCAVFRAHFPNTSLKDYYYFWNNTVQIYYYLFINYYIILYIF